MRMKALVSFASKEVSAVPGQEFSCSDELAEDLIRAKYAEPIEEKKNDNKSGDTNSTVPAAKGKRSRAKS
ncbi:MAG: hypothetical protein IJ555_02275 [Ruminococcus sp.]|nr:hypothetical protein [Ruminococcus sp.]